MSETIEGKDYEEKYIPFEGAPVDRGATIVIYGYDPIPGQLDPVVKHFAQETDVFIYTYDKQVVAGGDPERLPKLIGDIVARAEDIVSDYGIDRVRTVGASLGACVGMNIQDSLGLTMAGVYGACGRRIVDNFMGNVVFDKVRKIYEDNGHTTESMRESWKDIDLSSNRVIHPNMRFLTNARIFDHVVWYPLVKRTLRPLVDEGVCEVLKSRAVFHTATINEMARHIAEFTERADALVAAK